MVQTKLRMRIRPGNYKRYTRSGGGDTAMVVFLLAAGLFSVLPLVYSITLMTNNQIYDESSARLWLYFATVGGIMMIVMFCYNKFVAKRWE